MASEPEQVAARPPARIDYLKVAQSVLLALVGFGVAAVIVQALGYSPAAAYGALFENSFGSPLGISSTLWQATSLAMVGLAATVAFRAGIFNIGIEGQLYVGAFMGFLVGYYLALPAFIEIPLVLAAAVLGGMAWSLVPALLKAFRGVNEVVTTIMMNYIATYLVDYLQSIYRSPYANASYTAQVNPTAQFHQFFPSGPLDTGFVVAVLSVALVYFLLWYTPLGYQIRVSGLNPFAAKYAGVSPQRMTMYVMLMSGGLAGAGGALFANASIMGHFDLTSVVGVGFNGITVSLIGQLNPIGSFLGALLVGALVSASPFMQIATGMPVQIVQLLTGVIVISAAIPGLLETARRTLRRWKGRMRGGEATE